MKNFPSNWREHGWKLNKSKNEFVNFPSNWRIWKIISMKLPWSHRRHSGIKNFDGSLNFRTSVFGERRNYKNSTSIKMWEKPDCEAKDKYHIYILNSWLLQNFLWIQKNILKKLHGFLKSKGWRLDFRGLTLFWLRGVD